MTTDSGTTAAVSRSIVPENETLGGALLLRRLTLEQDQEAAGEEIGVSSTSYGFWERDQRIPKLSRMKAIAEYLGENVRVADVAILVRNTMRARPKVLTRSTDG